MVHFRTKESQFLALPDQGAIQGQIHKSFLIHITFIKEAIFLSLADVMISFIENLKDFHGVVTPEIRLNGSFPATEYPIRLNERREWESNVKLRLLD